MINLRPQNDLRDLRPRFQGMVIFVALIFLVLLGRLCQLQILEGDHFARRAERNFVDVVDVEAPRGRIFDVKGHPLATNRPSYTLYITVWTRFTRTESGEVIHTEGERRPMTDATRDLIASFLDFADEADEQQFHEDLEKLRGDEVEGRYPQPFRRNLSWDEYARISAHLNTLDPWVEIREGSRRYYPQGELTAFVTGQMGHISAKALEKSRHLGYRPGDRVGRTGIERQWENYLRGRLGRRSRVVDARNREVEDPPKWTIDALSPDTDPIPGQDIYLTLDLDLQRVAHSALSERLAGGVVAMDPKTGEILAMVSVPAIDPNRYEQPIPSAEWREWAKSPLKPFIDKTVQEHFFPGSTYKIVSALAALSDPTFNPEETYECHGFVKYGERKFRDAHVHGTVNLEQAIRGSCNTYFYQLAMRNVLSLDRVEPVARALGLGERTGLGLNGEVKGTIPNEEFEAKEGTYQAGVRLNSAIGQGNVKTTLLQMAVVYAAVANGGWVMTPYLVDRIETSDHKLVFSSQPQPRNKDSIIAEVDRQRIHRGLIGVVNHPEGTAYSERLRHVVVAGKTGTAQVGRESLTDEEIALPGWNPKQDHAWFAAYAPAEDPQIVVVAMVAHGGAGASAAAPIVMKVIDHYLSTRKAPTDTSSVHRTDKEPPLPGQGRGPRRGSRGEGTP